MEDIILYGLGKWFERYQHILRRIYNVIAVTDKNKVKSAMADEYKFDFICADEAMASDIKILICAYDKQADIIYGFIKSHYNVETERIIKGNVLFDKASHRSSIPYGLQFSLGEKNVNFKFALIDGYNFLNIGLFGIIFLVIYFIQFALQAGYVPIVDMMYLKNNYVHEMQFGTTDMWLCFFRVFEKNDYRLNNVYLSSDVTWIDWSRIWEHIDPQALFFDKDNRFMLYRLSDYLIIRDSIMQKIMEFQSSVFEPLYKAKKKICAVHLRGTDYLAYKPYGHYIQPTIENAIEKITQLKKLWGFDYLYLSTEDKDIYTSIVKEFGEAVLSYDAALYTINNTDTFDGCSLMSGFIPSYTHERDNDEYLKGEEYLISIYLTKYCNYLIGGVCGGTGGALFIKGIFEKEYFFNLGRYGFEEDAIMLKPKADND